MSGGPGGSGGPGSGKTGGGKGGAGGQLQATIPVTPGEMMAVEAGALGTSPPPGVVDANAHTQKLCSTLSGGTSAGGYPNGGGGGAWGDVGPNYPKPPLTDIGCGGGGGGGSFVRTESSDQKYTVVLVAPGGGGGGGGPGGGNGGAGQQPGTAAAGGNAGGKAANGPTPGQQGGIDQCNHAASGSPASGENVNEGGYGGGVNGGIGPGAGGGGGGYAGGGAGAAPCILTQTSTSISWGNNLSGGGGGGGGSFYTEPDATAVKQTTSTLKYGSVKMSWQSPNAAGGDGGNGASGGSAYGGAIYNTGKVTFEGTTFSANSALGANGGHAGEGGNGGNMPTSGQSAGPGGNGGKGGSGGSGGNAGGGAIDSIGTGTSATSTFTGDTVGGGVVAPNCSDAPTGPGCGGAGGAGGDGTPRGKDGATGSNGKSGSGSGPDSTLSPSGALSSVIITTKSLPAAKVGTSYHVTLAASGGLTPYKWTVRGLPRGVGATGAGKITGKPTTAGSFQVKISVTDTAAETTNATKQLVLTVSKAKVRKKANVESNQVINFHANTSANATPTITALCGQSGLQSELSGGGVIDFKSPCTLQLTKTLTVPMGDDVTLNGNANKVVIEGVNQQSSLYKKYGAVPVLAVKGGELILEGVTIEGGEASGTNGQPGASGGNGQDATGPAEAGGAGVAGYNGPNGTTGEGGGLSIVAGAVVKLEGVTFKNDTSVGGNGGDGGNGGYGGKSLHANGGKGGKGGKGGSGGSALGGAIYNAGTVTITGGSFADNSALGGTGGNGGNGGRGGDGGGTGASSG